VKKNLVPKIHWRIRWHHHEIHFYTNRHVAFPFYQEIHIAISIQKKVESAEVTQIPLSFPHQTWLAF
jgi:hypothetical protein